MKIVRAIFEIPAEKFRQSIQFTTVMEKKFMNLPMWKKVQVRFVNFTIFLNLSFWQISENHTTIQQQCAIYYNRENVGHANYIPS